MSEADIRSLDLNLLGVFDALYDERNVTAAAERLALTQPTVSGMLKRLRHQFGDELFVRTSHGVIPTPRADALAVPIKSLLMDARALYQPEAFDPATAEMTARICASAYLQHVIVRPFIEALRRKAPRARVTLSPRPAQGLAELLARGEMDIALSIRDVALPDLPMRPLLGDRYVCFAREAHPLPAGPLSMEDMLSYEHIFVDPTGWSMRGPIDDALDRHGLTRRVALTVPAFSLLFSVVKSENLLAFAPERMVLAETGLKIFETELETLPIEIIANWHPRMNRDARHMWLRETLSAVAKELSGQ